MTVITVNALETMLGGAAAAKRAYVWIEYRMAGRVPAVQVSGADVTLARTIRVDVIEGVPVSTIDAPATVTDVTYALLTVGSYTPSTPRLQLNVVIPEDGPVDIGELEVVDPAAFEIVQPGSTVAQLLALKANAAEVYSKTVADARYATTAQGAKADTAYQKPGSGIPSTDLTSAAQTSLGKADSAYQKPGSGVPKTDLAAAVQSSLGKADTSVQDTSEGRTALAGSTELSAASAQGIAGDDYTDGMTPRQATEIVVADGVAPVDARGRRSDIAFLTDSIGVFNVATAQAWHYLWSAMSGGLIRHRGVYGTAGYDLFQIESTHLPQVLALSPAPGKCGVLAGTNNVGEANVPFVETDARACLVRICDALEAKGIEPVLWELPPRDDSSTVNARVERWNVYVRSLAASRGYGVFPAHRALVDETDGLYLASLRLDDVHPNLAGHHAIAMEAASDDLLMAHFTGSSVHLTDSIRDSASMFGTSGRGMFLAGVDGGGRPTGWSEYTASSHIGALVTGTGIPGNWWEISRVAGSSAGGGYQYDFTTGFSVGDEIQLAMRYDMVADDLSAGFRFVPTLQALNSSNSVIGGVGKLIQHGGTFSGIASCRIVLPTGTTKVRINLAVEGLPTIDSRVRVGQITPINRTALGIA